jgi:hypothetical protein
MTIKTTVLFDHPQREIASEIEECLRRASSMRIVTGFATSRGIEAILEPLQRNPTRLLSLVVGGATPAGFKALDKLIDFGVPNDRLRVHLGLSGRLQASKALVTKYRPMLHSKVYFFSFDDGSATAFVGSHNLTHYALDGLNGEASIRLDGDPTDPEFEQIGRHLAAAERQARPYDRWMKDRFWRWWKQNRDAREEEAEEEESGDLKWEATRTIIVLASAPDGLAPSPSEAIYFEIPSGIKQISALSTEVHLFLFDQLPPDPMQAINEAEDASGRYLGRVEGAENNRGNLEVAADWQITTHGWFPVLERVPSGTLRPRTRGDMQQIRAVIVPVALDSFEYRFDREATVIEPVLSAVEPIVSGRKRLDFDGDVVRMPSKRRREVDVWHVVSDLTFREGPTRERDAIALERARPDRGSYILVSVQRRRLGGHLL